MVRIAELLTKITLYVIKKRILKGILKLNCRKYNCKNKSDQTNQNQLDSYNRSIIAVIDK